jgi:NRPS condensation-like uncharacterized protein
MLTVTQKRPLGYMESIQYILSTKCNIPRNVAVLINLEKTITDDQITCFFKIAQNRFSALRLRIEEINNIPHFVHASTNLEDLLITKINLNSKRTNWIPHCEKEINQPIDTEKLLWRIKIVEAQVNKFIIITFHHSIFDGLSIQKLLDLLNVSKKNMPLLSNNEVMYSNIEVIGKNNELLTSKNQEEKKIAILKTWKLNHASTIDKQKTKCLKVSLSALKVDLLKKYCHKNSITINHLLNAAVIKAIAEMTKNNGIVIHTPVDLRKYSSEDAHKNQVGCFITIEHSVIENFNGLSLLEIAHIYSKEMNEKMKNPIITSNFNYMTLSTTLGDKFSIPTNFFSGGIAISNIGEVNPNKSFIKDLQFCTSLKGGLGIFLISALTFKNKLNLLISYTQPLIEKDFIFSFIRSLKSIFSDLSKEVKL